VRRRVAPLLRSLPALFAAAAIAACGGGGGDGGGGGGGPLNITTATADDGVIGSAYTDTVAATGGTGAKTFSVGAGALPAGLTMSAAGAISGTPAGPAGRASFTVSVTDSAAMPATDTQALTIDIVEPLAITTAAIANPVIGAAYADSIAATGGTPPYTFTAASGLPAGLALAADGALTGTPAGSATTGTLEVDVTDRSTPALAASQSYRLTVAMEVATTVLADATAGAAYSDALQVQGGLPPYTWSQTGGALPPGLSLSAAGVVSGTPDAACAATNATLDVEVTDGDAPAQVASQAGVGLIVNPAVLDISTTALPAAVVGTAYDQRVMATGGVPPYAFARTGGVLPNQLSLNASNGRITGTPDTVGTQAFQVTVTDACPNSAAQNLSISVNNASLGRNDSIAEATHLPGDGSYAASISPSGDPGSVYDPDEDYYRIHTNATSTVTIDINAQVNGSPLDPVIEVVNSAGTVLNQCGSPSFTSECISDDEVLGVQRDSFLQLRVNGAATFYVHVVDWSGNARPDFVYDLVISGVN
jgi:hypothetical protein